MGIRLGALADLVAIAELHTQCFAQIWNVEFLGRLLAQPGAFSFIATKGGATVGFAVARAVAGEAEILSLGVRPASRRRGVGGELVRATANHAFLAGAREVFLEVAVENEAARTLYGQLGFCQAGRRSAYYHDREGSNGDALVLRRDLPLCDPPGGQPARDRLGSRHVGEE